MHSFYFLFVLLLILTCGYADENSKEKVKKDPNTYTDQDFDALYDEWEKNDPDEQHDFYLRHPQGKNRPSPRKLELFSGPDPETVLRAMKRGRKTMIFVTVSGNPTKDETRQIAEIWYMGLRNAFIDAHRYVIENDRAIYLVEDGALAYDVKDFLVKQDRCVEVSIDNQAYPGKGARKTPKFKLVEL